MEFKEFRCRKCGAVGIKKNGDIFKCTVCLREFRAEIEEGKMIEEMHTLADKVKAERVSSLRKLLHEKVSEEYTDSEGIVEICREIRSYLPEDFLARFYEVANCGTATEYARFLESVEWEIDKFNRAVFIGLAENISHHVDIVNMRVQSTSAGFAVVGKGVACAPVGIYAVTVHI